jgi:hypothetical protein
MQKPRDTAALVSLVPLALVVAGVLWADGRPLARMAEAVEQASRAPTELAGLRLLPFGWERGAHRADVVATASGLSEPGGPEVPWSSGDKALTDLLRGVMAKVPRSEPPPSDAPSSIELAVDARVPVPQLLRLIDLATQVELTTLFLVGPRTPGAPGAPASLPGAPSFLWELATALKAMPGASRVLLLPMLQSSSFTLSGTWVGELGAEHRLILSEVQVDTKETRTLDLTAPDPVIDESVPSHTLLYLTVTDQAALEDVAHAVRKAQAQGFEVLLSARPPPGSRQP